MQAILQLIKRTGGWYTGLHLKIDNPLIGKFNLIGNAKRASVYLHKRGLKRFVCGASQVKF
jgi:hypothetical protein